MITINAATGFSLNHSFRLYFLKCFKSITWLLFSFSNARYYSRNDLKQHRQDSQIWRPKFSLLLQHSIAFYKLMPFRFSIPFQIIGRNSFITYTLYIFLTLRVIISYSLFRYKKRWKRWASKNSNCQWVLLKKVKISVARKQPYRYFSYLNWLLMFWAVLL